MAISKKGSENNMKKRRRLFVILLIIMLLTGCNSSKENNITIADIDPESIVSTIDYEACFTTSYGDFATMAEASPVIVYGEISGIDYFMHNNGMCATIVDVDVIQSLKGEFQPGDTLQIEEDQGIATVEEYINSYETEDLKETMRNNFQQYSDEELDEIYVQQLLFGDVMFEIGQKYVFMLTESNYYDTRNTYSRVNGPLGSFSELSDNCFYWTQGIGSSLTDNYRLNTLDISAKDGIIEGEKPSTLDKLMNEMAL